MLAFCSVVNYMHRLTASAALAAFSQCGAGKLKQVGTFIFIGTHFSILLQFWTAFLIF